MMYCVTPTSVSMIEVHIDNRPKITRKLGPRTHPKRAQARGSDSTPATTEADESIRENTRKVITRMARSLECDSRSVFDQNRQS